MPDRNEINKYITFSKIPFLQMLLRYPWFGLIVHWTFQGITYMDPLERWFKIGFDAIFTLVFAELSFNSQLPPAVVWFLAWLMAHTSNFFLNSQIWVVLKHYGFVNTSREKFGQYASELSERIKHRSCIEYAALYGSIACNQWKPSSDLDVRLVHKRGFINGFSGCLFVFTERLRALFYHFPLDIYLLDGYQSLTLKKVKEQPIIIKQEAIF
jgi:hypothetical protein